MTKINFLALILCALPFISYGQRWNLIHKNSIDIITGAELSAIMVEPASSNIENFKKFRNLSPRSSINPTYRFGLDYNFALGQKWFLKSGGRFFQSGYTTNNLSYFEPDDLEALKRFSQNQVVDEVEYKYNFLQIPLVARWVYSGNRCKSFFEFGVEGNLHLNSKIRNYQEKGLGDLAQFVRLQENITPFHWGIMMSIGGEFWITKELPAFIQLNGRSQISKLETDGIKQKVIGMGIQSGIRYLF